MPTAYRKEVLTTGDVARVCHVAPRTVSKWFDTGKLRGYRIPGSRDRRIPLSQLLAFMRAHGIPLDALDAGACRVMILGDISSPAWSQALRESSRYEIRSAANGFEAGLIAQQFHPHVVVLDVGEQGIEEASTICRNIKDNPELSAAKVIAGVDRLEGAEDSWFLARGFDACLTKPFTPAELWSAVEKATNLIF